jgi:hypothetical protein
MGIFDPGVRVLARHSVDLVAVATFLAVEFETARYSLDLIKNRSLGLPVLLREAKYLEYFQVVASILLFFHRQMAICNVAKVAKLLYVQRSSVLTQYN